MLLTGSRAQAPCCDTRAYFAPWYVGSSGSRIESVSPALAGRFVTTGPPRKSLERLLYGMSNRNTKRSDFAPYSQARKSC